jgi:hypothetical protein
MDQLKLHNYSIVKEIKFIELHIYDIYFVVHTTTLKMFEGKTGKGQL